MSEGKFDAAINCLSVMADRDFANGAPHRGQFRAAIALLEAARKVSKAEMRYFIKCACHDCGFSCQGQNPPAFSAGCAEIKREILRLIKGA